MSYPDAASAHFAPTQPILLADTGATEDSNAEALPGGKYATLKVGATAIRVRFLGEAAVTGAVSSTDLLLNAYERYDWVVVPNRSDFVYCEAADGASAYQVWLWPSSPPV